MLFNRKQTTSNMGWDEIIQVPGQMALDFLVQSRAQPRAVGRDTCLCCSAKTRSEIKHKNFDEREVS